MTTLHEWPCSTSTNLSSVEALRVSLTAGCEPVHGPAAILGIHTSTCFYISALNIRTSDHFDVFRNQLIKRVILFINRADLRRTASFDFMSDRLLTKLKAKVKTIPRRHEDDGNRGTEGLAPGGEGVAGSLP
jgi:hypothetical protein